MDKKIKTALMKKGFNIYLKVLFLVLITTVPQNLLATVNNVKDDEIPVGVVIVKDSIKDLILFDQNNDFKKQHQDIAVFVKSYHKKTDGGGGVFYYRNGIEKSHHNGGTFICKDTFPVKWTVLEQKKWFDNSSLVGKGCWVRQYDGVINVSYFGARGDGVSDDTLPIQSAIDTTTSVVEFERKTYIVSGLNIIVAPDKANGRNTGIVLRGASFSQRYKKKDINKFFGTVLKLKKNSNRSLITIDSSGNFIYGAVTIENFLLDGSKYRQHKKINNISIHRIKDVVLKNLFVFNAKQDGISFLGSNNQVTLDGFIECYNNGRDGIWGGGIGDAQWPATVRCQNNGRYGFYMAAGQINAFSIYTYSNGSAGVRWDTKTNSHITYLRSEDNHKQGLIYNGNGLTIGHAVISDNGALSSVSIERVGILNKGRNLVIDTLIIPDRHKVDVHHNQRWGYYENGQSIGGQICNFIHEGYGLSSVEDEEPFKISSRNRNSRGAKIGQRRIYVNDYTDIAPLLLVGVYSSFIIKNCSSDFTLPEIPPGLASHNLEVEYEFSASSDISIAFPSDYITNTGNIPKNIMLSDGKTVSIKVIRNREKWIIQYIIIE
jgi:hypothetical protein